MPLFQNESSYKKVSHENEFDLHESEGEGGGGHVSIYSFARRSILIHRRKATPVRFHFHAVVCRFCPDCLQFLS